ncbi:DUF1768 domain-containing protein [archaeon]|nr:DUF1768 domain-containing protein [archaeon]NCQ52349.1 DUF1768 domain-containing protein [archaeon]
MQLHYGNLIEQVKNGEFDVIIHGANCWHTMGAGIARHIKTNFPEAFESDKKTGYGDKNKLGTFSEATIERNGNTFTVINAYTQYRYGTDKDHFDYDSFPSLLQLIKSKYGDKRIGIPLIGCGLAGGDEQRIVQMIKDNLEGVDYKLVEIDSNRKLNYKEDILQTKNEIAFTKVSLPFGWMGNMAPYSIVYECQTYKTTEALFQSLRFVEFDNVQKEIIAEKSPMSAKMVAKKYKHLLAETGYEVMGEKDVKNMQLCIQLKLEQYPNLTQQLIDTGKAVIIEDCSSWPRDSGLFWGAAYQNGNWVGKNILGEILMDFRSKLQNNNKLIMNIEELPKIKEEVISKEYTFFFHLTSPFSNFHPARFEYKDLTFISNEQFMMYSKAKIFGDEATAQKIIEINNEPLAQKFINGELSRYDITKDRDLSSQWQNLMMKAKKLGRGVQNYNEEIWNKRRSKIVLFGARLKFTQNLDLKQILVNTGDTYMVEASRFDPIWSCGLTEYDAKRTPPENWPGLNLLGKVLDEVKSEFKNELVKKPKP